MIELLAALFCTCRREPSCSTLFTSVYCSAHLPPALYAHTHLARRRAPHPTHPSPSPPHLPIYSLTYYLPTHFHLRPSLQTAFHPTFTLLYSVCGHSFPAFATMPYLLDRLPSFSKKDQDGRGVYQAR